MNYAVAVLLVLFSVLPASQAALPDPTPPIHHFKPDLDVFPQNFAISTDLDSRVFIGNSEGVLIYDGEYWQLVPLGNGDIVRSLKHDGGNRVYVGGYDEFGYVESDDRGVFVYHDLTNLYEEELQGELFADIWRIEVSDKAVYFVGLEHLFRYEPATRTKGYWKHKGSFGPITFFQGKVILQFRGEGLKYFSDNDWHLIEGPDVSTTLLSSMPVVNNKMIVISSEASWYEYDGVQFTVLPQFDALPLKGSVTHAAAINDTTVVVTTQLGKVVFVSMDSGTFNVVEVGVGFLPDAIVTPTGDTLVVDDLGFHSIHWPARWQKIDSTDGLVGTVNQVVSKGSETWVMTSSGAFVSSTGSSAFDSTGWTHYEAWHMLPLEDDSFLFADSYEIKHITGEGDIEIVDRSTTARLFERSRFDPDRVYVGTEYGLLVLQPVDGRWNPVFEIDDWNNLRVTQIIELSPGQLLLGSDRGGIRQVTLQEAGQWQAEVTLFDSGDGLEYGDQSLGSYLYELDGDIVASTAAGLFRFSDGRFEQTSLDGLADLYPVGTPVQLARGSKDQWAYFNKKLFKRNGRWAEEDVSSLNEGAISSVNIVNGKTVVGGLGTLLVFDAEVERAGAGAQSVRLSSAVLYRSSTNEGESVPLDQLRYSSADSRLTLRFALADFNHPQAVRYRTRLLPNEANFSHWTENSEQSLVALAPGDYEFRVEAKNSLGRVSSLVVPLTVNPQWHETTVFRLLLAFLLIMVLVALANLFTRRRSRRLADERDRLEAMVYERTRALESANKQLDKMAHLDGLTQIPNRRRLDSYLDDVWRQCVERSRVMAVVLIDVDHFKKFNDAYGHQRGDELLIELAKLLSSNLRRAEDLVARYGGEEFLAVLPGADEASATQVVEDMRRSVEQSDLGVTISAGLHVNRPDDGGSVSELVATADEALYEAKHAGRNRVVLK